MKLVPPPEKVFVRPKSVPAKLGARSTWLAMWPQERPPLKNQPTHSKAMA